MNLLLTIAFSALAQEQGQCLNDLRRERSQRFAALRVGDIMQRIGAQHFNMGIVVFFKTDCPFCEKLLPKLDSLNREYHEKGLRVFAICLDEDTLTWGRWKAKETYKLFENYCDGKSYLGTIATGWNVFATPSLFVVNGEWRISAKPKNWEQLVAAISALGNIPKKV